MAAVLLLVGRGLESPDIVRRLLDVEVTPLKPQYNMAPEVPPAHLANVACHSLAKTTSCLALIKRREA